MNRARGRKQAEDKSQVLMTGVRRGGEPDFRFRIHGNPASQFPPLVMKMTLHELQQWLHETKAGPVEPPGPGGTRSLRAVS